MCGINGFVMLKGVERNPMMMAKIRFIFDELMVETMDRGEHATGLASFKRDGSFELHKKDINADKMTTDDEKYREIVANFDGENTSVVIAHTRYYTKGKPSNNNNNHPFEIGNVVGLHNGSAKNDDWLFGKYKENFTRIAEVDSEIIFQLINHYNQDDITLAGLKSALEDTYLRGLFALAFVHKSNPNLLHLIKQEKPMAIAYWKEAGIVIFNSIGSYIEKAFRKLERLGHSFGLKDTKQTVEVKNLVTDDWYFTVNADESTFETAVSDKVKLYIESSSYTYTGKTSGTTTTTTGGTGTGTGTSSYKSKYEQVTATDSKGLVLQGEVDTITGEVIIWSNDDITSADDGSGLSEDAIDFTCFECGEPVTEEETQASWNRDNPKDESICFECYTEIMQTFIDEEQEDKVDCDGHKVG
jgi:glucosamine 6-phosphate synthetase-like amidotransferase/phosphosugar isomerase protein